MRGRVASRRGSRTDLTLEWTSKDLDRFMVAMKRAPEVMQMATKFATVQSLTIAHRHLQIYPPKRPGQTYRRTLTLGRTWTFNIGEIVSSRSRVRGSVWNPTPYAQWVQSDQRQAWMHRGRWTTTGQVTRGPFLKLYILYYQRALQRVARNLVGF